MKILFLSDIHACSIDLTKGAGSPSYVSTKPNHHSLASKIDPFEALFVLIKEKNITCDIVLCGGDLGDKADPAGIKLAWDQLQKLKLLVQAQRLFATTGNHDLDSRLMSSPYDTRGYLQDLVPRFPLDIDEQSKTQFLNYWALHFAVIEFQTVRIVSLNSCAYHGSTESNELNRGRITESTLDKLKFDLKTLDDAKKQAGDPIPEVNILLCHHHLYSDSSDSRGDFTAMAGSDLLTKFLDEDDRAWLVMHGHRHRAKLMYCAGSLNTPPILGAASFSATQSEITHSTPNQFYIVDLDQTEAAPLGLKVCRKNTCLGFYFGNWLD